jgi:hypothetical protein
VPIKVDAAEDLGVMDEKAKEAKKKHDPIAEPQVLSVADLQALDIPAPSMLIEDVISDRGASLIVGAPKSNKTLLAVQMGIAVASGNPFLENYQILQSGPVLILEHDDPAGAGSVKTILAVSPVPVDGIPFFFVGKVPYTFGVELLAWLEEQITTRSLRMVILDSYTALRGSRGSGIDIVKAEQYDLTMLDELAKRTGCAIAIIHHSSKGAAGHDWDSQAAGTFAMTASTEAQIHIRRFSELEGDAPERLVRIRGRHQKGVEMVIQFRAATLDHKLLLEGGASSLYPLVMQIQTAFGTQPFSPKDMSHQLGSSRATAHRQLTRLYKAGALEKRGYGEYVVTI